MVYTIRSSDQVDEQVSHLPATAPAGFADVRALLELAPWSGESLIDDLPEAPVRTAVFGPDGLGAVYYLIQERDRLVDLLEVLWAGVVAERVLGRGPSPRPVAG